MDGEFLVSLKEKHSPTTKHVADLRREVPGRFPQPQFFLQPANIVNQVLDFSVNSFGAEQACPLRCYLH
jgi:hypothetical protein